MPSVVPTETVVTGMPTLWASCAACCGVTRPAVWPPSEKTTMTAGGRLLPGFAGTAFATATARATASVVEAEALLALHRDAEAEARARAFVAAAEGDPTRDAAARRLEARARFVLAYAAVTSSPPRRADAIDQFSKCLDLDPRAVDAANDLAWLLSQELSTSKRALDLARRVTAAAPSSASFWDTRAGAAARFGDADDAVASWTKALEIAPKSTTDDRRRRAGFALRYAQFLRDRNRESAARDVIEKELAVADASPAESELRKFLDEKR